VSESPDRERAALEEIERALSAQDPRLARLLRRPERRRRNAHPVWLIAVYALVAPSACAAMIACLSM
jgi:Protein of unknown function (DUF3040)